MSWLSNLLNTASVAHDVVILSLVALCGLALGSARIKGIGLGIAGVLFSGLVFGHFGLGVSKEVLEFTREFGLILFVYAVGLQVGPGFLNSLRHEGLRLNLLATSLVLLGVGSTLLVAWLGHIPIPVAVGLFSGATTNTPSLAAAQQALGDMDLSDIAVRQPGLGYAVAYPFGVMGIILSMLLVRRLFHVDIAHEVADLEEQSTPDPLDSLHIEVTNSNLDGVALGAIPGLDNEKVIVSRVLKNGQLHLARTETIVNQGDVLLAVGAQEELAKLRLIVGQPRFDLNLREMSGDIVWRHFVATKPDSLGKTLGALDWGRRYGVVITRVIRSGIELTARPHLRLQFGDQVRAVGSQEALDHVADFMGNSPKRLDHPFIGSIFVGIALGILLGSIPFSVPGVPVPVKLGVAGGPLLMAILLSSIGRIGPLVWYLPSGANTALRELGIALFLACVGLHSGEGFLETLLHGGGLAWMGWASVITLAPLLIVAVAARLIFNLNFATICGVLAGSMTDPPALAFAGSMTDSEAPSVAYATVYPLVMILRIVSAQIIVLFFAR
jgi:putative transport protein